MSNEHDPRIAYGLTAQELSQRERQGWKLAPANPLYERDWACSLDHGRATLTISAPGGVIAPQAARDVLDWLGVIVPVLNRIAAIEPRNTPKAPPAEAAAPISEPGDAIEAKRRSAGERAIWDAVQELAPWCESNDMEWADEILIGLAGVRQRIEIAEGTYKPPTFGEFDPDTSPVEDGRLDSEGRRIDNSSDPPAASVPAGGETLPLIDGRRPIVVPSKFSGHDGEWFIDCVEGFSLNKHGKWASNEPIDYWPTEAATIEFVQTQVKQPEGAGDDNCGKCIRCRKERESGGEKLPTIMVVCQICGNKRCPHATDHKLTCTSSNKPGQPGSVWEHYRPPADDTEPVASPSPAAVERLELPDEPGRWKRDGDETEIIVRSWNGRLEFAGYVGLGKLSGRVDELPRGGWTKAVPGDGELRRECERLRGEVEANNLSEADSKIKSRQLVELSEELRATKAKLTAAESELSNLGGAALLERIERLRDLRGYDDGMYVLTWAADEIEALRQQAAEREAELKKVTEQLNWHIAKDGS